MPPIEFPQLPFLTREMLRKGNQMSISLRVTVAGDNTSPIFIRGFTRTSVINQQINPNADGENVSVRIGVDDFPIMISLSESDDNFLSGEVWGSIALELNNVKVGELCSGFISREKSISWPASNSKDLIPNRGLITSVASADPGNQAEALITVPAGEMWLIHSGSIILVTDVNAGNRRVHFVFTEQAGVIIDTWPNAVQTASITRKYSIAKFGQVDSPTADNEFRIVLPHDIWLDQLSTITTETEFFKAGDNYGIMRFQVEKFFDRNV